MEQSEQEKSKSFITAEIIEYVPNSVVIKTIIRKTTGNVTIASFDKGEVLPERNSPFDTFIQVIDGKAQVLINDESHLLNAGQSIIIPAHSFNVIKANVRFKMLSTIIKSGYEEVTIGIHPGDSWTNGAVIKQYIPLGVQKGKLFIEAHYPHVQSGSYFIHGKKSFLHAGKDLDGYLQP